MHSVKWNILILILCGCSLVIEPEYPPKMLVVGDTGLTTDTARPDASDAELDNDVISPDAMSADVSVEVDMQDVDDAMVDAEVLVERNCSHWSECYSGEYCSVEVDADTGTCLPGLTDDQCALMNDDPNFPSRTLREDGCCLPEDGEVRGECLFPFTVPFNERVDITLNTVTELTNQFSASACAGETDLYFEIDAVFRTDLSGVGAQSQVMCVELNIASDAMRDILIGDSLFYNLFSVQSCCEQTAENPQPNAEHCGFKGNAEMGTDEKVLLNVPFQGEPELKFALKVGSLVDIRWLELFETSDGPPFLLNTRVHDAPCCNPPAIECPEGYQCSEGLCE